MSGESINNFYFHSSVLHVLSISQDTHQFLSQNFAIADSRLSRIVNAIEPIFSPSDTKKRCFHWMPRKNPEHVRAIIHSLLHYPPSFSEGWTGSPLQNLSYSDVALRLNEALLFISFGHPEGFDYQLLRLWHLVVGWLTIAVVVVVSFLVMVLYGGLFW